MVIRSTISYLKCLFLTVLLRKQNYIFSISFGDCNFLKISPSKFRASVKKIEDILWTGSLLLKSVTPVILHLALYFEEFFRKMSFALSICWTSCSSVATSCSNMTHLEIIWMCDFKWLKIRYKICGCSIRKFEYSSLNLGFQVLYMILLSYIIIRKKRVSPSIAEQNRCVVLNDWKLYFFTVD